MTAVVSLADCPCQTAAPHSAGRIADAIDGLATDPRPPGSTKLDGQDGVYRIRVGDCRIIYQIEGRRLTVLLVSSGHRRDVYRKGRGREPHTEERPVTRGDGVQTGRSLVRE
jgi:mRNA interferase RelE/StbE